MCDYRCRRERRLFGGCHPCHPDGAGVAYVLDVGCASHGAGVAFVLDVSCASHGAGVAFVLDVSCASRAPLVRRAPSIQQLCDMREYLQCLISLPVAQLMILRVYCL